MNKSTTIWQIIVLILGLFLIFTFRTYLQDKIEIEAETKRADCLIRNNEKGLGIEAACTDIKTYKLKDTAKGFSNY
jgi:hypothetical protein